MQSDFFLLLVPLGLITSTALAQTVTPPNQTPSGTAQLCDLKNAQAPGSACAMAQKGEDDARIRNAIIVTARGREETVQHVPDTITLFNDALKTRRLEDSNGILNAAPGVFFVSDTDPGTNVISIRGISTNRGQDPSVTVAIDDHILPDSELFTLKPLDLVRVEIIKGPQGALFGKSAAAGAVRYISAAPGAGDHYIRFQAGNGGSFGATGAAGNELLRLAASFSDSSGFIRNQTLGKKVDGFQSINLRLAGKFAATDALSLAPVIRFAREKGGAAFVSSNNVTQKFAGRLSGRALTDPIGDFEGRMDRTYVGAGLTAIYDFASFSLHSTTSYDDYQKDFIEELDFRPDKPIRFFGFPAFPNGIQPIAQPVNLSSVTQELRLTSEDAGSFRWIVGGFYQHKNKLRVDDFAGFGTYLAERQKSTQTALFAQMDADVTRALTLTGGLRYDRVQKKQIQRNRSGSLIGTRSGTFDVIEPKISIAYRPAPDWLIYTSASTGYKPGGFNPPSALAPTAPATFASEKTRSTELGIKGKSGNLTVSAAAYLARHSNFQNTVFLDNNLVFSIPRVNISGVEASAAYQADHGFSFDGSLSITRARLGSYRVANPTIETPEPVAQCRSNGGTICTFTGNRIAYSPSMTLHGGAQWQGTLGAVRVLLRADVSHTGKTYYETDNVLYSPARTLLDARLALSRKNLDLSLWAKNLTDKRYALAAFGQQNLLLLNALGPGGPFDSFTISKGRQWGADVQVSF